MVRDLFLGLDADQPAEHGIAAQRILLANSSGPSGKDKFYLTGPRVGKLRLISPALKNTPGRILPGGKRLARADSCRRTGRELGGVASGGASVSGGCYLETRKTLGYGLRTIDDQRQSEFPPSDD